MSHAAEGSLQAFIDGELHGAAATALREHLAVCHACASELATLRAFSERAHVALALGDVHPHPERARALIASRPAARIRLRRRFAAAGSFGLAKAAMLLIALAGAGAAVIPGSPLRDALQSAFARAFGPSDTAEPEPVPARPATATRPIQSFGVVPAAGRVRIIVRAPEGAVLIRVRETDDELARIESEQGTPISLRTASGRAELRNVANSTVTISIPRGVAQATIEIDDAVYVRKQNGTLQLVQPREGSSRVRIQIDA